MPINRREFERGEPQPSFLIEQLLHDNADYAFTVEEVIVQLASLRIALKAEEVKAVLDSLLSLGRVLSKQVQGTSYYILNNSIGLR